MYIKSCSFIGHRKIEITEELKSRLYNLIDELISKHGVTEFLFGSRSEFDSLCYQIVTEIKKRYPNIIRISYTCKHETCPLEKDKDYWKKIYTQINIDNIQFFDKEFEHKTKYSSGKASYVERNFAMIDDSCYCVFYYNENYGNEWKKTANKSAEIYQAKSGTKLAYEYAVKCKKIIYNIF